MTGKIAKLVCLFLTRDERFLLYENLKGINTTMIGECYYRQNMDETIAKAFYALHEPRNSNESITNFPDMQFHSWGTVLYEGEQFAYAVAYMPNLTNCMEGWGQYGLAEMATLRVEPCVQAVIDFLCDCDRQCTCWDTVRRRYECCVLCGEYPTAHSVGPTCTLHGKVIGGAISFIEETPARTIRVDDRIPTSVFGCVCATECDCENPPPDDGPMLNHIFYGVSNECPVHNDIPQPNPDCVIHG